MRSNPKGDVLWEDNLLTWVSVGEDKVGVPRGLNMVPTAEGRVLAQEMLEDRRSPHGRGPRGILSEQSDFLEAAMGNGWDNVPPEDIGALTDATCISMDGFIGDGDYSWSTPNEEVMAALRAFWDSPEYKPLQAIRQASTKSHLIAVEGLAG
jgi:hypothetical protein